MFMMGMHPVRGRYRLQRMADFRAGAVMATGRQMQRQEKKNPQQKKRQGTPSRKFHHCEPSVA